MKVSYKATTTDNTEFYYFAADDIEAAYQGKTLSDLNNKNLLDVVKVKDYFPNRWADVWSLPDEILPTVSYSEVLREWAGDWSLPSGVTTIIRSKDRDGKVKECVYKSTYHATKKIEKLIEAKCELLIITNEYLHHIEPNSDGWDLE